MENKDFYRAFEDKHRGSRKLIKERVSVYLPFILPLKVIYDDVNAIDIGCGRGEWIELLNENGIDTVGLDLDEGMLKACKSLNFNVKNRDGIRYLQGLSDESVTIVSAFHVVEHISFEDLQKLVQEALRVLKPGGILILETPNPENIKVATENFYNDPTHIKPIPSKLLSFLPEFHGYVRSKVLRLQEPKELINKENITLLEVLEGVSPDYAVVAQKSADEETLKLFDEVFTQDIGFSLFALAQKFESRLQIIEQKANEVRIKVNEVQTKATNVEAKANEARAKIIEIENKVLEAEQRADEVLQNFHMVVNSNSWKLTKGFRVLGQKVRSFLKYFKNNNQNPKKEVYNKKYILWLHLKKEIEERKLRFFQASDKEIDDVKR